MGWEFLTSQEALKGRFKRRQRAGDLVMRLVSSTPLEATARGLQVQGPPG